MSKKYDVVVIGAGPGGYIAAIRAAQHGLSVACIDEWKNKDGKNAFGGTCLNAGCIPSKALLESSELYYRAQHEFKKHGITTGDVGIDVAGMQKRRASIVRQLTGGIAGLFKANKVDGLVGHGRLLARKQVEFTPTDGEAEIIEAGHVILATGSVPIEMGSAAFDHENIIDSWDALELDAVPERLGVIGAGVIGLELGSVWSRLGADVTIIDFKQQGIDIKLGARLTSAKAGKAGVGVNWEDRDGEHSFEVDKLIIAVGRKPFTESLLADDSGIQLDDHGFITVDDECRTRVKGVYAIGDCVRGAMLAHKASEEGVMAADLIAGEIAEVNYNVIPSVIYTAPEIAWVGQTEDQVKASGRPYKTGSFPFAANGRAKALEQTTGFVKIISAADDDEILGVHIVGPMAGELIAEAVLAMEFSASTEDIQRTIHAHPSLAESIHEAALAVDKRALNYMNR
jgi:dihydrolipoamide dehydrogenase